MDSTDVCQSVLGNFFGRATSGQFELKDPKQLVALLVTMARNRITNHALLWPTSILHAIPVR